MPFALEVRNRIGKFAFCKVCDVLYALQVCVGPENRGNLQHSSARLAKRIESVLSNVVSDVGDARSSRSTSIAVRAL